MNANSIHTTGAGSGGGTDTQTRPHYLDGLHSVVANQVEIMARPPMSPATSETPVISMLADDNGSKGKIEIRGSKSVRITSGPPGPLPMSSDDTDGVDVIAGESQKVTIKRGLIDGVDQKIVMEQGSITIDAGSGSITIQSLTEITLSVAGGTSTIRLTASGIVIQGILVQIN